MAAEWKESFDKSTFSNQWEHIYAAGWRAAKAAEALKPSHDTGSPKLPPCEMCQSTYTDLVYKTFAWKFCPWCGRQIRADA